MPKTLRKLPSQSLMGWLSKNPQHTSLIYGPASNTYFGDEREYDDLRWFRPLLHVEVRELLAVVYREITTVFFTGED